MRPEAAHVYGRLFPLLRIVIFNLFLHAATSCTFISFNASLNVLVVGEADDGL